VELVQSALNDVKPNRMHRVYKHRVADVCQPAGYTLAAAAVRRHGGGRRT